jgi:hypothetical protein
MPETNGKIAAFINGNTLGLPYPAQHFLGTIGFRGGIATAFELGQGLTLVVGEVGVTGLVYCIPVMRQAAAVLFMRPDRVMSSDIP